jgi:hypothetical protein
MNGFAVWVVNILFGEVDPPSERVPWHIFNLPAAFSVSFDDSRKIIPRAC